MKVSTAPASPEEYYQIFKKYAEEGYDILSISISSKISSTYGVAVGAADRVKAEYPQRTLYCLDALRMSGSMGLLVMYALEMQKEGKTMAEVIDWLESNKMRVHQMGPIDDLIFVARRGRISMGKAIMGSFAGVKPMGDCNRDGYVTVLTKAKGMKKALNATVSYVGEVAADVQNQYLLIVHSNREEYAMTLKEKLETRLNPKQVLVSDSYSASGTNIGPGMVGVYFLGDEVSEDLTAERKIMARVMESVR
jgi:DegV family protein with EDD domain